MLEMGETLEITDFNASYGAERQLIIFRPVNNWETKTELDFYNFCRRISRHVALA